MRIIEKIQSSKFYKWILNFCKRNIVVKTFAIIIIWLVAFIPAFLFLLARWAIGPEGFWQEFALIIAGGLVLGGVQAYFMIIAISLSLIVAAEGV
jgi:hypothetical protein